MEEESGATDHHLLEWLHDPSVSPLPCILDDPYNPINSHGWWDPDLYQDHPHRSSVPDCLSRQTAASPAVPAESPKKRKPVPGSAPASQNRRRRNVNHGDDGCVNTESYSKRNPPTKKSTAGKTLGNCGAGKEARWAEQLLNPCSLAIAVGDASRVQHYLCVLREVASPSGDANYRLAAHGLRALASHVSAAVSLPAAPTFAATDPKVFHDSLIRFNEISPWFSFTNTLANSSIVDTLMSDPFKDRAKLRIIDIGVSHGIQWPTLLEALTRRPGGPPELVRLMVMPPAGTAVPFSVGPPGDDFPSRLLRFAKRIDLNLQIDCLDAGTPLGEALARGREDETVVVCAQFRLHELSGHGEGEVEDERSGWLQRLRGAAPDLVVLSEYEGECGCWQCGDYAAGFARRAEFLWRFLDSTSAAFKGRECEERRVMEGEAATALGGAGEMREGRGRWCERMRRAGFAAEGFGEEATDSSRALLRKYDGNWEMKLEEGGGGGGAVCLCWRGQPVSFCSLWKLPQ